MRRHYFCRTIVAFTLLCVTAGGRAVAQDQNPPKPQEQNERAQDPPIPPAQIPERQQLQEQKEQKEPQEQQPQAPAPQPRSALNPDFSVIGNNLGRFFTVKGDPDRNRFRIGEMEIGIQQAIFPGIRFDAFLASHLSEEAALEVEEAYATFTKYPGLPFGGFLGQKRLNFGKVNPTHPHAWLYADTPAVLAAFLGEEGLIGNGVSANYTLPTSGSLFVNLEIGAFQAVVHEEHEEEEEPAPEVLLSRSLRQFNRMTRTSRQGEEAHHEHGLGVRGMFPMARLWVSHPIGSGGELDLGTSHGYGKGENGDSILIQAVDLTYRRFPGAYKRYILQTEWFKHRRTDSFGGTGKHSRDGYYIHLGYRPDQYYDYGIRYDNTRYPWPLEGSEKSLSFIWTNKLSEQTFVRAQLKHGDRSGESILPAKNGFFEGWLQFVWGGGPHAPHPVQ